VPVSLTYPGVYVQEIPKRCTHGRGVAISTTAFIGQATHGPDNEAHTTNCCSDFERVFGRLPPRKSPRATVLIPSGSSIWG
jgi:hypothetical protein